MLVASTKGEEDEAKKTKEVMSQNEKKFEMLLVQKEGYQAFKITYPTRNHGEFGKSLSQIIMHALQFPRAI